MRSFVRGFIVAPALLVLASGAAGAGVRGHAPAPAPASRLIGARPLSASLNPSGRVGRIRFAAAGLLFHAAREANWQKAAANYPVAGGEGFKTGAQGGAVIEIGPNLFRLDRNTEIEIAALDWTSIFLDLKEGRIAIRLARLEKGERVAVTLQSAKALLLKPGRYEIGPSRLAVFEGSARLEGGRAAIAIAAGKALALADGRALAAPIASAQEDAFTKWKTPFEPTAKEKFVSAGMTAAQELAAAGRWQATGSLGEVWFPKDLPTNWAPYRFGHWVWIPPWGWTWIDAEPWGFAPFHYGRWAQFGTFWGWVPGKRVPHPLYAPALVAFLGTRGVGISYAQGRGPAIGWFSLAPGEIYWPSYSRDLSYIRRLNRGAVEDLAEIRFERNDRPPVTVVTTRFANREAASVVPRPVFAGGQAVEAALLSLPKKRLEEAPAIMGSPRVTPAMLRALAASPPARPRFAARAVRLANKAPSRRLRTVRGSRVRLAVRHAAPRSRMTRKRTLALRRKRPAIRRLRVAARSYTRRKVRAKKPAARKHLIRARLVHRAPHRHVHHTPPRPLTTTAKRGLRRHSG